MEAEGTSFFIQECGLVNEVTEPGRKDTVTQNIPKALNGGFLWGQLNGKMHRVNTNE